MTDERYDDWASDPSLMTVEEIEARIGWLDEVLMMLHELAAATNLDQPLSSAKSLLH